MTLIFDAGALVALERNDRSMWRRLKNELVAGRSPVTHGGVIAQVWRGGTGRQAMLARALLGVEVVAVDNDLGRRAGVLLGRAGSKDAIDAAVVAMSATSDRIATSDARDIQRLVDAADLDIDVISV